MLRTLTVEKESICRGMTFCMDFAESSSELSIKIYQSLLLKETMLKTKLARLYLLSDILYNCLIPSQFSYWSYR